MGLGLKAAGIMVILMLAMSGAFYWYYNDTQERLSVLNRNNAKLETAVAISEETVSTLQSDFARANQELTQVNQSLAQSRRDNSQLREKLSEHELGYLAEQKPGLVEPIINRATENVNRCFELLTGAEPTTAERNAVNGNEFNSECPWLYNDLIRR
jgi:hypothetical protein